MSMWDRWGVKGAATAAVVVVLAATGCATTGDERETRRIAEEASAKADAAAADAAAARAAADAAAVEARKASEKADRIFQRSLHK